MSYLDYYSEKLEMLSCSHGRTRKFRPSMVRALLSEAMPRVADGHCEGRGTNIRFIGSNDHER